MALRTALHAAHVRLGAAFTEFAGYEMPVHYGSIKDEHRMVREAAGLFDVSHMSNLWIDGPEAAATISAVCPFDAAALGVGRAKYTVVLQRNGTILDDTIVFRPDARRYLMVPNAGRNEAVAAHLAAHGKARVTDATHETAILAVQGPKAEDALRSVRVEQPKPFRVASTSIVGVDALVSGTGYTGEKGAELQFPAAHAPAVWEALLDAVKDVGGGPVGLGARDTLRLEKGFCLAGNEFAGARTPVEAALEWTMDFSRDFLGKASLVAQQARPHERLWGLRLEKGIARAGHAVLRKGRGIGVVTSGTLSPTLGIGIALAYLKDVAPEDEVTVDVRGKALSARVTKPPFV